jgi:hypothetical protein
MFHFILFFLLNLLLIKIYQLNFLKFIIFIIYSIKKKYIYKFNIYLLVEILFYLFHYYIF